jgi:hypothetical protein
MMAEEVDVYSDNSSSVDVDDFERDDIPSSFVPHSPDHASVPSSF